MQLDVLAVGSIPMSAIGPTRYLPHKLLAECCVVGWRLLHAGKRVKCRGQFHAVHTVHVLKYLLYLASLLTLHLMPQHLRRRNDFC